MELESPQILLPGSAGSSSPPPLAKGLWKFGKQRKKKLKLPFSPHFPVEKGPGNPWMFSLRDGLCPWAPGKENSLQETPFPWKYGNISLLLQLLPYLKSRILWNAESFQAFPELTKSKAFSFPSFVDFSIPKLGFMERSWPADGKIPFSRSVDPPELWGRWESKQIPN